MHRNFIWIVRFKHYHCDGLLNINCPCLALSEFNLVNQEVGYKEYFLHSIRNFKDPFQYDGSKIRFFDDLYVVTWKLFGKNRIR